MKEDLRAERKLHRIEENKAEILRAAETVFSHKGYSQTSVDDIAEEAQFSKATIYRYFKSKDEIFYMILLNSFKEAYESMAEIQRQNIKSAEKLEEIIKFTLSYYEHKKNIARIIFIEKSPLKKIFNIDINPHVSSYRSHPPLPQEFMQCSNAIYKIMCDIIAEGIERGEFRDVDVQEAAHVLSAMMRGVLFQGPMRNKIYTLNESISLLIHYFLNGIKAPNSREE